MFHPLALRIWIASLTITVATAADLWNGITPGPFDAGFRFERTLDPARNLSAQTRGKPLGLAIWYPARKSAAQTQRAISQIEYRLLVYSAAQDRDSIQGLLEKDAALMVAAPHIGIVPLTLNQARSAIEARGRALRHAPPAPGRFPIVLVLGGPYYLSTTAEILASQGNLVAAPVEFMDQSNEIPQLNFASFQENSLRDAEWALTVLSRDPAADPTRVSVLGHGGGGFSALLLAMRNRAVTSVINIDAGNFSTRTNPKQIPSYHPRLVRVPFLYIATAATRRDADLFSDFEQMKFSRRYELILEDPAIRHHDLSDLGHGVAAFLGLRGEAQDKVLRTYVDVQHTIVEFLKGTAAYSDWLNQLGTNHGYSVRIHPSVDPAPPTAEIVKSLGGRTLAVLREARQNDPEAEIFSEEELRKVVNGARRLREPALLATLALFALELHPESLVVQDFASAALGEAGNLSAAAEVAGKCADPARKPTTFDSAAAQARCRERVQSAK